MSDDYASASKRHLDDTERLFGLGRWDNAAYLAGYVAECGAKAVIGIAGYRVQIHLDRLSRDVLALAADVSLAARRYRIDLDGGLAFLRRRWSPHLRYTQTGSTNETDAEAIVEAATSVFAQTIGALVLDGLLERMPT